MVPNFVSEPSKSDFFLSRCGDGVVGVRCRARLGVLGDGVDTPLRTVFGGGRADKSDSNTRDVGDATPVGAGVLRPMDSPPDYHLQHNTNNQ